MEKKVGFLVNMSCTFLEMVPYLTEFCNNMNYYSTGRDTADWKFYSVEWSVFIDLVYDVNGLDLHEKVKQENS